MSDLFYFLLFNFFGVIGSELACVNLFLVINTVVRYSEGRKDMSRVCKI